MPIKKNSFFIDSSKKQIIRDGVPISLITKGKAKFTNAQFPGGLHLYVVELKTFESDVRVTFKNLRNFLIPKYIPGIRGNGYVAKKFFNKNQEGSGYHISSSRAIYVPLKNKGLYHIVVFGNAHKKGSFSEAKSYLSDAESKRQSKLTQLQWKHNDENYELNREYNEYVDTHYDYYDDYN